jgi:hypothetical protein
VLYLFANWSNTKWNRLCHPFLAILHFGCAAGSRCAVFGNRLGNRLEECLGVNIHGSGMEFARVTSYSMI